MIKQIFALAGLVCGVAAHADSPVAYVHARIYPVSGAPITDGTLIVSGGKITAVGKSPIIPPGARRVDLHGATVIPGLVDASSSLFITEETFGGAASPDQNVLDGIDPFDKNAAKVLQRGITTVYVSPGGRGGLGGVVKLQLPTAETTKGVAPIFETALKQKAGLQMTLGVSSAGRSSSLDRLASYQALRAQFASAKNYLKQQEKAEAEKKAAQPAPAGGPPRPAAREPEPDAATEDMAQRRQFPRGGQGPRPQQSAAPRTQPIQETLAAALKGEIPVRIEAHRSDDILNALRLQDEFHFKLILESPEEADLVLSQIKSRGVSIIWSPMRAEGAPTLESNLYSPTGAAGIAKAGLKLAVSARSSSGVASRFLLQTACMAISAGLSEDAALKAVTLDAAEMLGVGEKVGSLKPGKDADFVVLTGSPFRSQTHVSQVFVGGVQVYGAL